MRKAKSRAARAVLRAATWRMIRGDATPPLGLELCRYGIAPRRTAGQRANRLACIMPAQRIKPLAIGMEPDLEANQHQHHRLIGNPLKQRAHNVDHRGNLQGNRKRPDPRFFFVLAIFPAGADPLHLPQARQVQQHPDRKSGIALFAKHFEDRRVEGAGLVGDGLIADRGGAAVGNRTGREGSIKYRLTRALETRIVKGADAVFTICNGLRDDLIARGVSPAKIGVMPNGVDLELFGAPPPRDAALAETLGLAPGVPVIGYIGSFYDYEGVDDLIAAMPILRASHPEARLLLVGAGVMEAEWRAAAARLPESEAVIFTGRVPHTEVERYYSLVDVLAYPRKAQRLTDLVTPLKPLEAMAQQKLVAASDVGGHRELISHGKTGYLFPADDPAACAACLSGVLNDRENWTAMKQRAADHVRSRHDWAVNVRNYLPVYHLLLAHASPAGTSDPQPAKAGISPR